MSHGSGGKEHNEEITHGIMRTLEEGALYSWASGFRTVNSPLCASRTRLESLPSKLSARTPWSITWLPTQSGASVHACPALLPGIGSVWIFWGARSGTLLRKDPPTPTALYLLCMISLCYLYYQQRSVFEPLLHSRYFPGARVQRWTSCTGNSSHPSPRNSQPNMWARSAFTSTCTQSH